MFIPRAYVYRGPSLYVLTISKDVWQMSTPRTDSAIRYTKLRDSIEYFKVSGRLLW